MTLCRRALATSTRTLATGSEERLSRLGRRCWLNWSMGIQSSSTMACRKHQKTLKHRHTGRLVLESQTNSRRRGHQRHL